MKRTTTMGTAAAAIALMCAAMLAAGCSSTNKDPQMMAPNASVTDVSVTPTPLEAPAPIAQPVISDAPTQAPAPIAAAPGGGKYTVQKGDTLWKIATASYGNGNQWQRIANANPGLTPTTLRAGQTIMIP